MSISLVTILHYTTRKFEFASKLTRNFKIFASKLIIIALTLKKLHLFCQNNSKERSYTI